MRAAAVLAALLAATPTLSAQEVLLRMRPRQGQVTHYLMTAEMFMRGGPLTEMAADPDAPFMRLTGWTTATVTGGGTDEYTERQVIDSARVAFPAMPQMEQMMAQMGDLMSGTETEMRMTSRGRVLAVHVRPSPAMEEMVSGMGRTMPGMGMGTDQLASSSFWLLPERAVRVGDSWRDSMRVALDSAAGMGAAMTVAATYTLRGMDGSVARIGFAGAYTMSVPAQPADMTFDVTGEIRLDLDAGRIVGTEMEMKGTAPTQVGAVPLEMRMSLQRR